MPFGGLLSLAGPVLGIGSALGGLFGGSSSKPSVFGGSTGGSAQLPPGYQVPQGYQTANNAGADWNAYNGIGGLGSYNVAAELLPQYQQIAQNMVNNPYGGGYQSGAGTAGALGQQSGMNAFGAGGALTGSALSQLPDVNALLSLGFDPQNALYSKLQQQNADQTNASLGQRGLATTPYGAGVANQSNQDFNLAWQNNLLNRATQGAGAAGNLMGSIGNSVNSGQALQAGAPGQYLQGSASPYNTFQNINANALQTLGQTGQFGAQAATGQQQQIQDYLSYLGQGTAQQQANNQTGQLGVNVGQLGLNQSNQSFNQNQTLGSNLGSSLAGLSKAWGNTGWGANPFGGTASGGSAGGTGGGLGAFY